MENTPEHIIVTKVVPDTTYPRTMSIEGSIVHVKQTTDLKDGVHYVQHGYETKNVDEDTIIKHFVHDSIIKVARPRLLKKLTGNEVAKLSYVIDPTDYPATGGAGITVKERNIRYMIDRMDMDRETAEYYESNPDELKKAMSKVVLRKANK